MDARVRGASWGSTARGVALYAPAVPRFGPSRREELDRGATGRRASGSAPRW